MAAVTGPRRGRAKRDRLAEGDRSGDRSTQVSAAMALRLTEIEETEMDGARFVLFWPDGVERFTDERDRSARARELNATGQVTAAWTERTLDVLVRLAGDECATFEWDLDSTPRDVVAAYPNAVAYRFPDLDDDYTSPWLQVGQR